MTCRGQDNGQSIGLMPYDDLVQEELGVTVCSELGYQMTSLSPKLHEGRYDHLRMKAFEANNLVTPRHLDNQNQGKLDSEMQEVVMEGNVQVNMAQIF